MNFHFIETVALRYHTLRNYIWQEHSTRFKFSTGRVTWQSVSFSSQTTVQDTVVPTVPSKMFQQTTITRRSQWPRSLTRRSAAARLLGLWVWIPPGTYVSVSCECWVYSGRGNSDRLITRPEESYECDREVATMRGAGPLGAVAPSRRWGLDNDLPPCFPLDRSTNYVTDTLRCW